jgi:hypothetical protein
MLVESIAPPAIGAIEVPDLGFNLQVNARVAQGSTATIAIHVGCVHFDSFHWLGHGNPHTENKVSGDLSLCGGGAGFSSALVRHTLVFPRIDPAAGPV